MLVFNKIDLLQVELDWVVQEIEDIIGIEVIDVVQVSVKIGFGVEDLFECLVNVILAFVGDWEVDL